MRRIFIALAVLILAVSIAGIASAAELTQLQTAQLEAVGQARSVVSDGSVIAKIWYTGTGNGAVGVSNNSTLILYSDYTQDTAGYTINTASSTYDTVGELVDYINGSCTDFSANVGPDGYRALDTDYLLSDDITKGPTSKAKKSIYLDSSTAGYLTCGVEAKTNITPRIRQYVGSMYAESGLITEQLYDGDTCVWRRDINRASWINASSTLASGNTVTFSSTGDNGVAGTKNTPFVLKVTPSANVLGNCETSEKTQAVNVSIIYDELQR